MSRTKLLLSLLAVLGLGGLCLYVNRDWFSSEPIQIFHRVSPWMDTRGGRRSSDAGTSNPVSFSFDRYYRFLSIKVFVAQDVATNKYPHAIWHLVSSSNSVPTSAFVYGSRIRGMEPAVQNARPDPLQPGVQYQLVVQIGDKEARHNFTTTPRQ